MQCKILGKSQKRKLVEKTLRDNKYLRNYREQAAAPVVQPVLGLHPAETCQLLYRKTKHHSSKWLHRQIHQLQNHYHSSNNLKIKQHYPLGTYQMMILQLMMPLKWDLVASANDKRRSTQIRNNYKLRNRLNSIKSWNYYKRSNLIP